MVLFLLLKLHRSKFVKKGRNMPFFEDCLALSGAKRPSYEYCILLLPIGHEDDLNAVRIGGKYAGVPAIELNSHC